MPKLVLIGAVVLGAAALDTVGYPSDLGPVSVTPGFEVSDVHTVSISAGGAVHERASMRTMTGNQVETLIVGEGGSAGGMRTIAGNQVDTLVVGEGGGVAGMRTMSGNQVETLPVGGGAGAGGMIRAGSPSDLGPVSITPGFEVSDVHTVSISAGGAVLERASMRSMTGNQVETLVVGEGGGVGGMRTMSGNQVETLVVGEGGGVGGMRTMSGNQVETPAGGGFARDGMRTKIRARFDARRAPSALMSFDTTATTTVIYGTFCRGEECQSSAICPTGTWVQKCDTHPSNGGDGCRVSEDGGTCFAHNVKAKVHCGHTGTSSVESIDIGTSSVAKILLVSASCDLRRVVSCSCFGCGHTSSFYPTRSDGNTCRMQVPNSAAGLGGGAGGGAGAKVYAICLQERTRISSGTCESAGFEMITQLDECVAEAKFMDIPFNSMIFQSMDQDAFPGGCIYASNQHLAFNPMNAMDQNVPCGQAMSDDFTYDCICKKQIAPR